MGASFLGVIYIQPSYITFLQTPTKKPLLHSLGGGLVFRWVRVFSAILVTSPAFYTLVVAAEASILFGQKAL